MLLVLILLQLYMFLNAVRLKKCAIEQPIDVFLFNSIPDQYETQEICGLAASLYLFLIVHCPDKYITERICDETVDDFLAALKVIPDWFTKSKMIKKLYTAL